MTQVIIEEQYHNNTVRLRTVVRCQHPQGKVFSARRETTLTSHCRQLDFLYPWPKSARFTLGLLPSTLVLIQWLLKSIKNSVRTRYALTSCLCPFLHVHVLYLRPGPTGHCTLSDIKPAPHLGWHSRARNTGTASKVRAMWHFWLRGNQPSANSRVLSRPFTEHFLCVQLQLDGWG